MSSYLILRSMPHEVTAFVKDRERLRHPDIGMAFLNEMLDTLAAKEAACPDHRPIQHRDRKPPWCNLCGKP